MVKPKEAGSWVKKGGLLELKGWRRNLVLAAGPVFVIILGLSVGYVVLVTGGQDSQTQAPGLIGEDFGDLIDRAYRRADTLQVTGDYRAAKQEILNSLKNVNKKEDLARGYNYLSIIALNAEQYDDALDYAQKTEDIQHSVDSAALVASSAKGKGDRVKAIEYYKKAVERLGDVKDDENAKADQEMYINQVAELEK
jgi:tetratricopeptide (TPR) repeat protein